MEQINAYVPEHLFFDGKKIPQGRVFHDDTALVYVQDNYKIVVSRGFGLPEGEPLYSALRMDESEKQALFEAIRSKEHFHILACQRSTLLLFSDLLHVTGLVLVIRLAYPDEAVRHTLFEAHGIAQSPLSAQEHSDTDDLLHPPLEMILAEIFYYTDRIFGSHPTQNAWLLCRLIANFAGCRLSQTSFPAEPLPLSPGEHDRLVAFLLATFLGMWKFIAPARAIGTTDASASSNPLPSDTDAVAAMAPCAPTVCISVTQSAIAQDVLAPRYLQRIRTQKQKFLDRLLKIPAFSCFRATLSDGDLLLDAHFPLENRLSACGLGTQFREIRFRFESLPFAKELLSVQEEEDETYMLGDNRI